MIIDMTKQSYEKPHTFREMGLKEQNKRYTEYKILTFDIETWGLNPQNLALAVFFNGENYIVEFDKKGVMAYLESLENDCLIYAHNGMKYDYLMFFDEIIGRKFKFTKAGDINLVEFINKKGSKIVFKDTVYIFNQSLKKLAQSFGGGECKGITPEKFINPHTWGFNREEYEKNKAKYNFDNLEKDDVDYCKQDCLVLFNILHNEQVKNLDVKEYNTIGKIANKKMFEYIEAEFGSLKIDDYVDSKFKNLYSGGLTDVFKHNAKGKIKTYDVNSMYPFSMTSYFPNVIDCQEFFFENSTEEYKSIFWDMLRNFPNGKSVVTIQLKEGTDERIIKILKTIPLLPNYKTAYLDYFDCRVYQIEIMNIELKNLLDPVLKNCIDITPIYSIFCLEKDLFYPFKNFITETYNKRIKAKEDGRDADVQLLKILMNSSYGYLAMQVQNVDYLIGSETFIANDIFRRVKEVKDDYIMNIFEFKKDFGITFNEIDFVPNRADLFDYFEYVKDLIGDDEDLSLLNLEEIEIENKLTNNYLIVYKGRKCQTDRTSFLLASEITAKSRAYLGEIALKVANSGNTVCYCDTDSLHIKVNNEESLKESLEPYVSKDRLGGLKDEGTYEMGYWFAKKHYYLFKEEDKKYILEKYALKGFPVAKPIDSIINERNIVNVSKMASRVKYVSFNSNAVTINKSFLNFTVSRKTSGEFFPLPNYLENLSSDEDVLKNIETHKIQLKKLYWSMVERGDILIPDEDNLIPLSKKSIEARIKEINENLSKNEEVGVYESERSFLLLPERIEKEIAKLNPNNPRYYFKKYVDLFEEKKENKLTRGEKRRGESKKRGKELDELFL